MKVLFKSTNNELFKELENLEGELSIDLRFTFNFPTETVSFDLRKGYMHSSLISSYVSTEISRGCFELVFTTEFSVYTFIYGTYDESNKPLTDDEKLTIAMATMF